MDREGTDTDLAYKAGADAVAIAGPTETAIRIRTKQNNPTCMKYHSYACRYSYTRNEIPRDCPNYRGYSRGIYGRADLGPNRLSGDDRNWQLDQDVPELVRHIQEMMRSLNGRRYC